MLNLIRRASPSRSRHLYLPLHHCRPEVTKRFSNTHKRTKAGNSRAASNAGSDAGRRTSIRHGFPSPRRRPTRRNRRVRIDVLTRERREVGEKVIGNIFGLAHGSDRSVQITRVPQGDGRDEEGLRGRKRGAAGTRAKSRNLATARAVFILIQKIDAAGRQKCSPARDSTRCCRAHPRHADLLSEVAGWTLFTDCFTHLRSGRDGCRSAHPDTARPAGRRPQSWPDAHGRGLHDRQPRAAPRLGRRPGIIRDETYALALRRLVDHQQREPLAAVFGDGFATSSSDGQFFRAAASAADVGRLNASLRRRSGKQILYARLRPFCAVLHQG